MRRNEAEEPPVQQRASVAVPNLSEEQARKQEQEYQESLRPKVEPMAEAARSAEPGSSPVKPLSDDAEAAARFTVKRAEDGPQSRRVWDRNAYNQPVIHEY